MDIDKSEIEMPGNIWESYDALTYQLTTADVLSSQLIIPDVFPNLRVWGWQVLVKGNYAVGSKLSSQELNYITWWIEHIMRISASTEVEMKDQINSYIEILRIFVAHNNISDIVVSDIWTGIWTSIAGQKNSAKYVIRINTQFVFDNSWDVVVSVSPDFKLVMSDTKNGPNSNQLKKQIRSKNLSWVHVSNASGYVQALAFGGDVIVDKIWRSNSRKVILQRSLVNSMPSWISFYEVGWDSRMTGSFIELKQEVDVDYITTQSDPDLLPITDRDDFLQAYTAKYWRSPKIIFAWARWSWNKPDGLNIVEWKVYDNRGWPNWSWSWFVWVWGRNIFEFEKKKNIDLNNVWWRTGFQWWYPFDEDTSVWATNYSENSAVKNSRRWIVRLDDGTTLLRQSTSIEKMFENIDRDSDAVTIIKSDWSRAMIESVFSIESVWSWEVYIEGVGPVNNNTKLSNMKWWGSKPQFDVIVVH